MIKRGPEGGLSGYNDDTSLFGDSGENISFFLLKKIRSVRGCL